MQRDAYSGNSVGGAGHDDILGVPFVGLREGHA